MLWVALILSVVLACQFLVFNMIVSNHEEKAFLNRLRGIIDISRKTTYWLGHHEMEEANQRGSCDPHVIPPLVSLAIARASVHKDGFEVKYVIPCSCELDKTADEFEREALAAFRVDPTREEFYKRQRIKGQEYLCYAVPIRAEKTCLSCHGMQNWVKETRRPVPNNLKENSLIAALAIKAPTDQLNHNKVIHSMVSFTIVFLTLCFISIGIYILTTKLVTRPLQQIENTMMILAGDQSLRNSSQESAPTSSSDQKPQPPVTVVKS
jgi:hypothetical protein